MNKKLLAILIAVVLVVGIISGIILLFNNSAVPVSSSQENSLSAYELAIKNGFDGTVEEWLDSLSGKSPYDIAVDNGYSGTEEEWNSTLGDLVQHSGASVKTASLSPEGELILTLSDDTVLNLGKDVGTERKDGAGSKNVAGNNGMNINRPSAEPTTPSYSEYTVVFKDYDGTVIKTENVESRKSANAPDDPQREGYIFSKWDKSFDKVTSDMVITAEYTKIVNPTVMLQGATASPGDTVQIPIKIYNNPGINGIQLNVSYDERLTLTKAENGTALSTLYFTQPGAFTNPSKFLWDGVGDNDKGNGEVLLLTFEIPADAQPGDEYRISATSPEGTVFDSDLNDVAFDIVSGSIKIK
ncbi:MAG: cohesin domain-containing protein [Acutalibacteraceae bacterium]